MGSHRSGNHRCTEPGRSQSHRGAGGLRGVAPSWSRAGLHRALSPLQIPVPVLQISATQHPVKAGLSDAFMILNPSPEVPGESLGCTPGAGGCWDPSRGAGGPRGSLALWPRHPEPRRDPSGSRERGERGGRGQGVRERLVGVTAEQCAPLGRCRAAPPPLGHFLGRERGPWGRAQPHAQPPAAFQSPAAGPSTSTTAWSWTPAGSPACRPWSSPRCPVSRGG